ncbi:MAG: hypothetical protein RDV41_07235 [Planctomycetota bacterium]|nr:hypothetical protein [Planctomycetota bacterium]
MRPSKTAYGVIGVCYANGTAVWHSRPRLWGRACSFGNAVVNSLAAVAVLCVGWLLAVCGAASADEAKIDEKRIEGAHFDVFGKDEALMKRKMPELEWAADRFKGLFGAYPAHGAVVFMSDVGDIGDVSAGGVIIKGTSLDSDPAKYMEHGAKWVLPWFDEDAFIEKVTGGKKSGKGSRTKAGRPSSPEGVQAITHEAAHMMFWALVNDGCAAGLRRDFNGYGSFLPDWLDEGVAVYHESDSMRKERYQQLKERLKKHIPFDKFFTMDHPSVKTMNRSPVGPGDGPGAGDPTKPGDPGGPGMPPSSPTETEEWMVYYAQSLAVVEYLAEIGKKEKLDKPVLTETGPENESADRGLGGGPLILQVCAECQKGSAIEDVLKKLLPPKYHDLANLEQMWLQWVKSR